MRQYQKPYTWTEIEYLVKKELEKTRHIMTFGTIGSCDVIHDIDIIITKKPNSKSSEFYKEIHEFFDRINRYLQMKFKAKLITTRKFVQEVEVCKLARRQPKDLIFHVMTYISYQQGTTLG